jgi:hypothetical protein
MQTALIGAMAIAAISTLGDFVWAELGLRHKIAFGLAHGTILFLCIGAFLGSVDRQVVRGAVAGALVGVTAAGAFYALSRIAGYAAMFAVWAFIWLGLAIVSGRALKKTSRWSWRETLTRGILAMVGSGVAFYLISGIWRPFNPRGWDYAVHFFSWSFAYLPAFFALLFHRHKTS